MANKTISLQDVCEKCTCKDEEHYIDMTDFYIDDYRDIITHLKPLNIWWNDVTVMDLFNIPLATDKWIIDFIKTRLNIDITSKEWIEKINALLKKALDLYERRYLKNVPLKLKKLNFKATQSILNFIKETKTNKTSWSINCAIAKVSYAVDDVLSNEKVRRSLFLDRQFIQEHLERPFQIEEWYEDKNWNIYRNWKVTIDWKIINFKIIARQKWKESIMWKQLSDAKYYSIDEFKDLVWVTVYVESDWQAALMMQYIDQMIYKWKSSIKNKNWLDLQAVKSSVYLNEEFYLKLEKETKTSTSEISEEEKEFNERKNITSENYREIKLVWNVELSLEEWFKSSKYPIWTEIKFVVGWHDNEKWLSLQTVYDYLKRFKELTRLWIPIRKIDVVNYINEFFDSIEENLKKKNKSKQDYFNELFKDLHDLWYIDNELILSWNPQSTEKTLALWLYEYFLGKLVKIKLPHSKKEYYFDENILNMRDAWLYKTFEQI